MVRIKSLIHITLIILFLINQIKSDIDSGQFTDLNNLKIAYGFGWSLTPDTACSNPDIICSNNKVVSLYLKGPTNPNGAFPDLPYLVSSLSDLALEGGINLENFWDVLPSLTLLGRLSISYPFTAPNNMSQYFPNSLTSFSFTNNENIQDTIFYRNLTTLTISQHGPSSIFPTTLVANSNLMELNIFNFQSFFSNPDTANKLKSLKKLFIQSINQSPDFSFDQLSLFKSLEELSFSGRPASTVPNQPVPSTLYNCKSLKKLSIGAGWFIPPSTFNLSSADLIEKIILDGSFLSNIGYPGILIKSGHTVKYLEISSDPSFTSLNSINLVPFINITATGGNYTELVNEDTYYRSKQLQLNDNKLQGIIPVGLCQSRSFNLINNQFNDLPSCMYCSAQSLEQQLYPNPNLPTFYSVVESNCSTFQILNYTSDNQPSKGGFLMVYGIDMGWNAKVDINGGEDAEIIVPNIIFKILLPDGAGRDQSLNVHFHAADHSPITRVLNYSYIPPKINSVEINSTNIDIYGSNFGVIASCSITVDGVPATVISFFSDTHVTIPSPDRSVNKPIIIRLDAHGQSDTYFIYLNGSSVTPYLVYPLPQINQISSSPYTLSTSYFKDANKPYKLVIDNTECHINNIRYDTINVDFLFTCPSLPKNGIALLSLSYNNGILYDYVNIKPQDITCVSTPHGNCKNNILVCDEGWTGNLCQSQIIINNPNIGTDSPETSSNTTTTLPSGDEIKFSTLVSIVELREYDGISSKVINRFPLTTWVVTTVSSSEYLYQTEISHNTSIISLNVTIKYYKSKEVIEFAEQSFIMNPSTLKYQISMNKYPFERTYNRLMLVMNSQIQKDDSEDSCSRVDFGNDQTSNDQFQYVKLQVNQVSLYGKFIKFAMIDNRPTIISNTLLPATSDQQDPQKIQSQVGINIPHFSTSAILDPDFSVLIDSNSPSETDSKSICNLSSSKSSSLTKTQKIGIIVGGSLFLLCILIIGFLILYKKSIIFKLGVKKIIKLKSIK